MGTLRPTPGTRVAASEPKKSNGSKGKVIDRSNPIDAGFSKRAFPPKAGSSNRFPSKPGFSTPEMDAEPVSVRDLDDLSNVFAVDLSDPVKAADTLPKYHHGLSDSANKDEAERIDLKDLMADLNPQIKPLGAPLSSPLISAFELPSVNPSLFAAPELTDPAPAAGAARPPLLQRLGGLQRFGGLGSHAGLQRLGRLQNLAGLRSFGRLRSSIGPQKLSKVRKLFDRRQAGIWKAGLVAAALLLFSVTVMAAVAKQFTTEGDPSTGGDPDRTHASPSRPHVAAMRPQSTKTALDTPAEIQAANHTLSDADSAESDTAAPTDTKTDAPEKAKPTGPVSSKPSAARTTRTARKRSQAPKQAALKSKRSAASPKKPAGKCGCGAGDLMCAMRCSMK